jgi:predicted nucleic acid-binding protein
MGLAAERPRGVVDGLIAATAAVHGKIIVTRNVTDFADTRVPLINPWDQ